MLSLSPCMLWAWVRHLSYIIRLPLVFILEGLPRMLDWIHNPPASTSQEIVTVGPNQQVWDKNFLPATLWLTVGVGNAEFNTNSFQSDSVRTLDPKLWSKLAEKHEHSKSTGKSREDSTRSSWFGSMFEEQVHMFLLVQRMPYVKKLSGRFQDSMSEREHNHTEPWALPLSFPLGRGGCGNQKKERERERSLPAWVSFEKGKV